MGWDSFIVKYVKVMLIFIRSRIYFILHSLISRNQFGYRPFHNFLTDIQWSSVRIAMCLFNRRFKEGVNTSKCMISFFLNVFNHIESMVSDEFYIVLNKLGLLLKKKKIRFLRWINCKKNLSTYDTLCFLKRFLQLPMYCGIGI